MIISISLIFIISMVPTANAATETIIWDEILDPKGVFIDFDAYPKGLDNFTGSFTANGTLDVFVSDFNGVTTYISSHTIPGTALWSTTATNGSFDVASTSDTDMSYYRQSEHHRNG